MSYNKIVYGHNTLIDITGDTITADKLAAGYTAHDKSGARITGTLGNIEKYFSKEITYDSSATTHQLIWSTEELSGCVFTSLEDYEFISIMAVKTDNTHTTNQLLFSNSFYPYFRFNSSVQDTGVSWYHANNTGGATVLRNTRPLTTSTNGGFYITNSGIMFGANSSYALRGTYIFTLSAKPNE